MNLEDIKEIKDFLRKYFNKRKKELESCYKDSRFDTSYTENLFSRRLGSFQVYNEIQTYLNNDLSNLFELLNKIEKRHSLKFIITDFYIKKNNSMEINNLLLMDFEEEILIEIMKIKRFYNSVVNERKKIDAKLNQTNLEL